MFGRGRRGKGWKTFYTFFFGCGVFILGSPFLTVLTARSSSSTLSPSSPIPLRFLALFPPSVWKVRNVITLCSLSLSASLFDSLCLSYPSPLSLARFPKVEMEKIRWERGKREEMLRGCMQEERGKRRQESSNQQQPTRNTKRTELRESSSLLV